MTIYPDVHTDEILKVQLKPIQVKKLAQRHPTNQWKIPKHEPESSESQAGFLSRIPNSLPIESNPTRLGNFTRKRRELTAKSVDISLMRCWIYKEIMARSREKIELASATCSKQPVCLLSPFSRVWLCDPVDCSPPGSSAHGILQARILEWVAMPFSRGSSQPRDQTRVS